MNIREAIESKENSIYGKGPTSDGIREEEKICDREMNAWETGSVLPAGAADEMGGEHRYS